MKNEVSWPDLYAPLSHPYYILAPGYRESSSGIATLHYLCHALNLLGQEAYLVGKTRTKQGLRAPLLDEESKQEHGARIPIAIYPEIVEGNPLNTKVVVRYIMNKPGLLDGNDICAGPDDLFFYFHEMHHDGEMPFDGLLTFPVINKNLFHHPEEEVERKRSYLYLNRHPRSDVDFSLLPDDIEILSMETPLPLEELARIFQNAAVLYSYEISATCTMAILCGCPVLYIRGSEHSKLLDARKTDIGPNGWAWIDDPNGLEHARTTTLKAYGKYCERFSRFWKQLSEFIALTQERARESQEKERADSISSLEIKSYEQWRECRRPSPERQVLEQAILQANEGQQCISILMVDSGSTEDLERTLSSIAQQTERPARIWLASKRRRDGIRSSLEMALIPDAPVDAFRKATEAMEGGCLWLLHAGDQLQPHALQTLALRRLTAPEAAAWYCDIEYPDEQGALAPLLYPDFSLDLFRSYPYMGRSIAFEVKRLKDCGQSAVNSSELYASEWIFRLVEAIGPQSIRHVPEVLLTTRRSTLQWAWQDKVGDEFSRLLRGHLDRLGLTRAEVTCNDGLHTVNYLGNARPKVSILMPTRDLFEVLRTAIDSLLARTSYPDYELILIDHDTQEPAAKHFLSSLAQLGGNTRVLSWKGEFNYSAMVNMAARQASGELLLMLDNDVEITDAHWLTALVGNALRPEVAVVGPRLELPDGRIDQAGLVVGLHGGVGRLFRGLSSKDAGYMQRLKVASNVSALSSTCMMIRKVVFEELGGLDAEAFPVYFGDVDLCLRAGKSGYLNVYTPGSRLRHMGGASRLLSNRFGLVPTPSNDDYGKLYARWGATLGRDPSFHPACSRYSEKMTLDLSRARLPSTPLPGRPLPTVMAINANWGGCGMYRLFQPLKALERHLLAEGAVKQADFNLADVAQVEPATVVLQGTWSRDGVVEKILHARELLNTRVLMDFDDYNFNIPVRNKHKRFFPKDAARKMRRAIEVSDGLIVSTQPLAEEMLAYHDNVRVMHNRLEPTVWSHLTSRRRVGTKVRVGWAGGTSHTGDLMILRDLIKAYQDQVEWVFMGMRPDGIQCEYHAGVQFEQYPETLANLNLDLAVVPLELNRFNECKSNLRLLELGVLGIPIICTDIEPYRCGLPVTRVRNRYQDWSTALEAHLGDMEAAYAMGDRLREGVLDAWMLDESAAQAWAKAWLGEP